jgi:hypothetical protein
VDDIDNDAIEDIVNEVQKKCAQWTSKERKSWADTAMNKLNV